MKKSAVMIAIIFFTLLSLYVLPSFVTRVNAEESIVSKGQTVYVPAYSHVFVGGGKKQISFNLSINLIVRNTDLRNAITIVRADFYDSNGNLVKHHIEEPLVLKPMASTYLYIAQSDTSGGLGANYIIQWKAETPVNQPIIESVTYGSRGTHSISFVSQGKVIKE